MTEQQEKEFLRTAPLADVIAYNEKKVKEGRYALEQVYTCCPNCGASPKRIWATRGHLPNCSICQKQLEEAAERVLVTHQDTYVTVPRAYDHSGNPIKGETITMPRGMVGK